MLLLNFLNLLFDFKSINLSYFDATLTNSDLKTEIKILLQEGSSNKEQGNCFERLIRNLLSAHQYEVRSNINFSGMEIDLIAKHKHKSEILYVECKAKDKVTSDELSKFCFNVEFKEANTGYFFRTKELESQAGALLSEIRKKEKYKNLTFFEPSDIIRILSDAKFIVEPSEKIREYVIAKRILAITYFGDFLIYSINESNLLPTKFLIINAQNNESLIEEAHIEKLKEKIDDIKDLNQIQLNLPVSQKSAYFKPYELVIENISEVQESENWFDYLPASTKDFVGREKIRVQFFEFFKAALNNRISKRVFYLTGKSGWGKSSIISDLRGRCRSNYYKNRFYTLAIDTRSATSDNFVALSFEKLINAAIKDDFIKTTIFDKQISFTSNIDLLSSDSVQEILGTLKKQGKLLVLIFDQFEDVFRKQGLFKSFYKFLSDVTDKKPNLIVGFSWKTEIVIPIDHEAYSYWQQAKEQAKEFTMQEFGEKEIDGVIKQLESSVGSLNQETKRRIKESSQGLPWLTKKLCIHIYEQIKSGLKKDKLIDSNLNIKELFEKDKERIDGNELSALKYIAKKASEGNFFDISEIGDQISSLTIESLRDKRLIIRSGANYNIYWDIFRDYLVTNEIPPIGESYILRQGVNVCLEVFLLFKNINEKQSLQSLLDAHPRNIGEATLENVLIELRNVGLVKKLENEELYELAIKNIEISKEGFNDFITSKFQNYTPLLKLKKLNLKKITKDDITKVLKETFKYDFQDKTWDSYAMTLIGWFSFSNLEIKPKIEEPRKGRKADFTLKLIEDKDSILLRSSLKEIISTLKVLKNQSLQPKSPFYRDLQILEILDSSRNITSFGTRIIELNYLEQITELKNKALELNKYKILKDLVNQNKIRKAKELLQRVPKDFFKASMESSKLIYASKALSWVKN